MILVDGRRQETVSIQDRALHYGDGLFETLAVRDSVPLAWDLHRARLSTSCARLGFHQPDDGVLLDEVRQVSTGQEKTVVKVILSRGEGGRGYSPGPEAVHTRIVAAYPWPDYPAQYNDEGIVSAISKTRLGHNPALAGIKHLNRLEQVLVAQEVAGSGLPEMVVLDIADAITEGGKSNIFLVKNEVLYTPKLELAGVEGVIRKAILDQASEIKLETRVEKLGVDALYGADEIFFCNSIIGLWPVKMLDDRKFNIGPVCQLLRKTLVSTNMIHN